MTAFSKKETWTCDRTQDEPERRCGLASDGGLVLGWSAAMAQAHRAGVATRRRGNPPPAAAGRRAGRRPPSRASRSTASRCSTSATTSSRSTPTGSTPCASPGCRRSRTSSARTTARSPACARAASASGRRRRRRLGELEDHLRVRAVRHRRRLRADDVPPAPRMGRARRVRRRPVPGAPSAIRTCSRTRWSTGGRPVFRGSATCRSARRRSSGDTSNLMLALARPGASGDQGVYADRIELEGIGPLPAARLPAAYKYTREVGLRPRRRHAAADQVGRHARRRSSISPATPPAGD